MSNQAIVNGVAVNGTPISSYAGVIAVFSQVVNETRPEGVAVQFKQAVGVNLEGVIAVFSQEVQLRSSAGASTELVSFAQQVVQSYEGQVAQLQQWVVDDA